MTKHRSESYQSWIPITEIVSPEFLSFLGDKKLVELESTGHPTTWRIKPLQQPELIVISRQFIHSPNSEATFEDVMCIFSSLASGWNDKQRRSIQILLVDVLISLLRDEHQRDRLNAIRIVLGFDDKKMTPRPANRNGLGQTMSQL